MIARTIEKTQESSSIAKAVMAKLQELPLEQQQEVLNFVESLAQKLAPHEINFPPGSTYLSSYRLPNSEFSATYDLKDIP